MEFEKTLYALHSGHYACKIDKCTEHNRSISVRNENKKFCFLYERMDLFQLQ